MPEQVFTPARTCKVKPPASSLPRCRRAGPTEELQEVWWPPCTFQHTGNPKPLMGTVPSACFPCSISCLHSWSTIYIWEAWYGVWSPSAQIHPALTLTARDTVLFSLSIAMVSFPGPQNKLLSHTVTKLLKPSSCTPACCWFPARALNPQQDLLLSPCPMSHHLPP